MLGLVGGRGDVFEKYRREGSSHIHKFIIHDIRRMVVGGGGRGQDMFRYFTIVLLLLE